ncbi:phosphoribosylanthranilate isomerase [Candidatus Roizmanbacteria bacterium]|nr:phosphoribosylanthranilate isomerase [Candidatus Roizmanbacteria bacterium]
MKTKVKICGIRTLESAQTAIDAGADFLGFNFIPTSKRYIKLELAKKILKQLKKSVKIVGVFQNSKTDFINKIVRYLDLDFIQLHKQRIIKNVKNKITYELIDRKIQGKGAMVDLNKAGLLTKKSQVFFAGGLNSSNVSEVIKKIKPYAVDVASGIETNGNPDPKKIQLFIQNAKKTI